MKGSTRLQIPPPFLLFPKLYTHIFTTTTTFGTTMATPSPLPPRGERSDADDRVQWVRHDRGDRYSFHGPPSTFQRDKRVSLMTYANHNGKLSLMIHPTETEIEEMNIQTGDEYYPIWEVVKPGRTTAPGVSTHPVPYFRLRSVGPWSNWHHANKVAFKPAWKSSKDGKSKTKYLQRQDVLRFVANCTAPAALLDYSLGVGIYCFFMRCRFSSAQPWSADFGRAKIVALTANQYQQNISAPLTSTAGDDMLEGPRFSADVCRVMMERLGLQRVNGTFQDFDWSWLTDKSMWKDGNCRRQTNAAHLQRMQRL